MDNACSKSKDYLTQSDVYAWMPFIQTLLKGFSFERNPVEAVLVHGWGDLRYRLIQHTARIFHATQSRIMVLNGHNEYEKGAPGFSLWKTLLVQRYSIPKAMIFSSHPARQTHEEAVELLKVAKREGVRSAAVLTVPFHLPRAFLTHIAVAKQMNYPITLVPSTFLGIDWEEEITFRPLLGSAETTLRIGRFGSECVRAIEYRRRMDARDPMYGIASVSEGLRYTKECLR
ncbi:MAG: ElyC/SanA/YdcF family protein [Patescibacteria group bacterium]